MESPRFARVSAGASPAPAGEPMQLRNTYWLLRHGISTANEQDLIVSLPDNGTLAEWGLSDLGREQAEKAGEQLLQAMEQQGGFNPDKLRFYSSPFTRAVETAARAASHLEVHLLDPRMKLAPELRERYFGSELEMTSTSNYDTVWAADAADPSARPAGGGESVEDVAARLRALLARLESEHSGCSLVLVSHGDSLSILAALAKGTPLAGHRQHGLPNCGLLRLP